MKQLKFMESSKLDCLKKDVKKLLKHVNIRKK